MRLEPLCGVLRQAARRRPHRSLGRRSLVSGAAKKTGKSAPAVKKAVKKVGNVRKRVENRLAR
jgi:hypothetical protein